VEIPHIEYGEALDLQRALVDARVSGILDRDVLLLLEHPSVFTLGRRGKRDSLLVQEDFLKSRGIQVVHVERGGDITYHGPGQIVGYPIVNLQAGGWRVVDMVEALEEVMIRTAADWGIEAGRSPVNRGVWVNLEKLGSIGIAVRRGVSFHGFALNVNTSLEPFSWIHPCGLTDFRMTTMGEALQREIPMEEVRRALCGHMAETFNVLFEPTALEDLIRISGVDPGPGTPNRKLIEENQPEEG
jgi:lipoate-protein ligase B